MPTADCSRRCSTSATRSSRDELNHASIIDGIRLCKAQRYRYANNDMAELEACLQAGRTARARGSSPPTACSRWTASSPSCGEICDLADRYDALVMVDDSHAIGFMGATGRGTPEHCGVLARIDIFTGTLGKALGGGSGGYIAARKEVVEWLRQRSRPYLFSNSIPPVVAAASLAVLELLEHEPQLRAQLFENSRFFREGLSPRGLQPEAGRAPDHPGHAGRRRARHAHGGCVAGARRLRHRLLLPGGAEGRGAYSHPDVGGVQRGQLERALDAFTAVGRELGVIGAART